MRIISIILILSICIPLWSQPGPRGPASYRGKEGMPPPARVRPFAIYHNESVYKVYLFAEIMHDLLQFTLENNEYHARFETEVVFTNEKTKETFTQIWESDAAAPTFELTNSRRHFFLTYDSLKLPPGEYDVAFRYQDQQGKLQFPLNFKFRLPEIKPFYASSPLFLDLRRSKNLATLNLEYPVIATFSKIPFNQEIGLFMAAHAEQTEQLEVHLRVQDSNSNTLFFQMDTLLLPENSMFRAVLKPPFLQLEEGNYTLDLHFKSDSDSLHLQSPLEVRWLDKPHSLRTLEYALKPLEIILDKEEYDQINSGSKQEKAEKFLDFWKTKDPTPGTAYNELLFEFYSRVDSVDREFGGKNRIYGWRTDPGKIILLYGHPDFIEDQSLNPVRPFLSWRYDLPDTTLTFIFEAIDGRKRYRLIGQEENSN